MKYVIDSLKARGSPRRAALLSRIHVPKGIAQHQTAAVGAAPVEGTGLAALRPLVTGLGEAGLAGAAAEDAAQHVLFATRADVDVEVPAEQHGILGRSAGADELADPRELEGPDLAPLVARGRHEVGPAEEHRAARRRHQPRKSQAAPIHFAEARLLEVEVRGEAKILAAADDPGLWQASPLRQRQLLQPPEQANTHGGLARTTKASAIVAKLRHGSLEAGMARRWKLMHVVLLEDNHGGPKSLYPADDRRATHRPHTASLMDLPDSLVELISSSGTEPVSQDAQKRLR
mmetsp:Transcript_16973/g.51101  ORF Transcript_16973/g.51101 Transcript_16973/m.51101 type:complete len:289 (+) Transcript_16973:291-1157(+)